MSDKQAVATLLLAWWDGGHAALPWRESRDPYNIWVSEVMLQQTQIGTVRSYYLRWSAELPDVEALAKASEQTVLKLWEGLGYYRRALNLHRAAQLVAERGGILPDSAEKWRELPGVGRYTANAIASIAFDERVPVVDGNVIRVLSRLFDLSEDVTQKATLERIWQLSADLLPYERIGDYNQAVMELGQRICLPITPRCQACPVQSHCLAKQRQTIPMRPVRPPAKRPPRVHRVGLLLAEGMRLFCRQNSRDGLLGGLWGIPQGAILPDETAREAALRELREQFQLDSVAVQEIGRINHSYTHFHLQLSLFYTEISGAKVGEGQWLTREEAGLYPFSTLDQQIWQKTHTFWG